MPKKEVKDETVFAEASDTERMLRLSDSALVAMDEERILIGHRGTGAFHFWPKSDEEAIGRYMAWRSFSEILAEAIEKSDDTQAVALALNAEIKRLDELTQIGVLEDRINDLSGDRLNAPDGSWLPAMNFLLQTRTTRDTVFAVPAEYNKALAELARFERQPSAYYERVGAPTLLLPDPKEGSKGRAVRFEEVMKRRRTARRFANAPITLEQLSKLLHYGWGETNTVPNPLGDVFVRKTSPSGGSLHPIEVYPIVMNVEGLEQGLYHYSVRRHALEQIALEDPRQWIAEATGDQDWVAEAGVAFLTTAFLPRTAWKYRYARVARAVISEIGFTGQAAFLTATWLGLGAFHTIALRDEIWEEKLKLDPGREPVFAVTGAGQLEEDLEDHSRPRYETAPGVAVS